MIKAVVFDLWETMGTKNIGVSKSLQERFNLPRTDDYGVRYEKSVQLKQWESEAQMAENFLSEFGIEKSSESTDFIIRTFKQAVHDATLFEGMYELFVSLKEGGTKLGLLSNTTNFESTVLQKWGIKDLFDATAFSWHKGNLKPSAEAFQDILNKLDLSKEETLLVDDTMKNIEAAEAFGIKGVLFEDIESLKRSLAECGVMSV